MSYVSIPGTPPAYFRTLRQMKIPYPISLQAGKTYAWCTCGRSSGQPLCDGSHKGTGNLPLPYKSKDTFKVAFCGCKRTKNPPFCDGSHVHLGDSRKSPDREGENHVQSKNIRDLAM